MTFLFPSAISLYDPDESANLKIDVTALPVAFSFVAPVEGARPGVFGDEPGLTPVFSEAGEMLRTSFLDWYYRIHVIPAVLSLGNVAGDVQRTVVVWNAFFEPVTLEAFTVEGIGITVDGVGSLPQELPPLEEVKYVFSISGTGPAVIVGEATWTIEGVDYVVPINGRRSVLFSFRPDWKLGPVRETLEWKNTLSTSFSGRREQIMRVRQTPRRLLSYRIRLRDDDARLMDQAVFGWTGRVFSAPMWHEKVKTQADAAQGAETLLVDTTHSSFVAGGSAVLFRTATDYEVLDIESVTATSIALINSLSRPWPRGSQVIPVAPAVPQEGFNFTRALPRHLDSGVDFTFVPAGTPLRLPVQPAPASYRGLELYTLETNWRESLPVGMTARRVVDDGGLGTITSRPRADFPLTTRGMSWLLKNRVEADKLRAFFKRRDGIRVPVWMPSGTEDFILAQQAELGATALRVSLSQYGSFIDMHPARRHLVLMMRNGDRIARQILEANDEGGGTTLTLGQGLPYVITPASVKRISFLGLYRLSSDTVSFDWRTSAVAECDVSFTLKVPE